MKHQTIALGLLSSIARKAIASAKLGDVEYGIKHQGHTSSTGFAQTTSSTIDQPGRFSSDIISDSVTTLQPSSVSASQSTSVDFNPTGQRIILAITPSANKRKRDIGGFVGTGDSDDCTLATVFTLGNGRLLDGGVPISYLGEAFQSLRSLSAPASDDITSTFSSDGGVLRFVNPGVPGGEASFCQTSSDGQVYLTFTSQPQGCVPVRLTIYGAERCINGRIDGIEASTATIKPTKASEQPMTQKPRPTSPDPADEEPGFPTMIIDPTRALTFSNSSSRQTTAEPPTFTSDILLSSLSHTRSEEPTSDETSSDEPSSVSVETSVAESTTTSPPGKSSSSIETLPSSSALTTTVTTGDDTSSSTEFEIPSSTGDSETMSTGVSESTFTEASDSSAPVTTSFETTTEDPTTTTQMETTTTTEEVIIITNRAVNGRFAKRHPNSDDGVMGFETEGTVAHRNGDCFDDDSSQDDGCVALEVSSDRKRGIGSFAGISQQLLSGPSGTLLYTVQFYYAVISVQGSRPCTLGAYLGDQQVCSERLLASDSLSQSWHRVLTMVRTDSHSSDFGITMSCQGSGAATVHVDSVFISNQVTASNIDNHHLAF